MLVRPFSAARFFPTCSIYRSTRVRLLRRSTPSSFFLPSPENVRMSRLARPVFTPPRSLALPKPFRVEPEGVF